jgi:LPXTG-motif cell wall-anchored protein
MPKKYKKENHQKIITSILGFFGMILIMTNLRMTGATIGSISNVTLGLLGMGMAAAALLIFLKNQKKKL